MNYFPKKKLEIILSMFILHAFDNTDKESQEKQTKRNKKNIKK